MLTKPSLAENENVQKKKKKKVRRIARIVWECGQQPHHIMPNVIISVDILNIWPYNYMLHAQKRIPHRKCDSSEVLRNKKKWPDPSQKTVVDL